ncbi:NTF2 fold immunity protein [Aeoliella sp.]|uniref:NTF2 fold immunity protein n=1 Tax=Aeoliella sp. TaxID=2795800 RepID=UPI003CCBE7F2
MNATDRREILDLLTSFFDAMGAWESDCKSLFRRARQQEVPHLDAKKIATQSLESIFARYCSYSNIPARASYGAPHFSTIPVYGRDCEEVLDVQGDGDTATVFTQQRTAARFKFIYHLVRTEKGWRLEDNRETVNHDGSTSPWDL